MDSGLLETKFARIGAAHRASFARTCRPTANEFFEIVRQPGNEAEVAVLDVQPADSTG
jgi:hypothetical protein